MSDKKFDPKAWLPKQEPAKPRTAPQVLSVTGDLADQIEIVTQRIEAAAVDITGGYEEWRNIGLALVDALGERGRDIFHRISRFSPKYDAAFLDSQYSNWLHRDKNGVTSACLPGISGIYDRHLVYPNFYVFVTAGASSGKGSLTYTRYLIDPIHEEIPVKSEAEKADYEAKMEAYSLAKPSVKRNMEKTSFPPSDVWVW